MNNNLNNNILKAENQSQIDNYGCSFGEFQLRACKHRKSQMHKIKKENNEMNVSTSSSWDAYITEDITEIIKPYLNWTI